MYCTRHNLHLSAFPHSFIHSSLGSTRQELESALEGATLPKPLLSSDENSTTGPDRGSTTYQNSTGFFQSAALSPNVLPPLVANFGEVESRKTASSSECLGAEIVGSVGRNSRALLFYALEPLVLDSTAIQLHLSTSLYKRHACLGSLLFTHVAERHTCPFHSLVPPRTFHAALLEPYDDGKLFSRHARALLFEGLPATAGTIPEVQTLLVLSAQECGAGNRTQAWLYSGMAFRLIEDMGLCVDNERYAAFSSGSLTDEDIEIRNRLFWSCYFWGQDDLSVLWSFAVVTADDNISPQVILDDSAEDEKWTPHGLSYPSGAAYPPTKSHAISSFMHICSLSVILNQILLHMYDPRQQSTRLQRENASRTGNSTQFLVVSSSRLSQNRSRTFTHSCASKPYCNSELFVPDSHHLVVSANVV